MDAIFEALANHNISVGEAIERVLYHREYGGNREDAKAVVDEWCQELDARQAAGELPARKPVPTEPDNRSGEIDDFVPF